ncbi:GntR family transcriptional regulator [Cellulosilyticum sp. I15G10I2]|uniref:GntR family transcriptional regulator n=1 Tax=Cellulosilyticum sp. I15G10I2 TaxID=1892843 RepID=UPI00085C5861|nr:GntR family transcriptional regulator [Cellulosilyticum sp. I15G10I2]
MYYRENERQNMTIGESVYGYLRNNIIELNFKPGEIISIKDISAQLNVSRSPVRDALIKLEKEGLITTMPQRGTMISKIDLSRVSEERYLRECLEEKTILLFMNQYTPSDIKQLESIIENQKKSISDTDYRKSIYYDDEFHKTFFDVTDKRLCWETIQNMSGHYKRSRLLSLAEKNILDNIIKQHEMLIACILEKNTDKLIIALHLHLNKLEGEDLDLSNKYPDLFENQYTATNGSYDLLHRDFFKMLR